MLAAAAIGFTSCNDSFMERYPDTSLTEQTVFSNYNTFKTYAWGLYGVFTNTNILRIPGTNGAYASATSYTSDIYAGYLMRRQGDGNPYAFQNVSSSSSGNGLRDDGCGQGTLAFGGIFFPCLLLFGTDSSFW